jgi:hypothetical protein
MTDTLPGTLHRLDTTGAGILVGLVTTFEELQTVLRGCERLVTELARVDGPLDDIVIESVWTTTLLSYARCFAKDGPGTHLSEADVSTAVSAPDVVEWHRALLKLRDHYADRAANPRELFTVAVAQTDGGDPSAIAITSAPQPLVDDATVRQSGAIAFALSSLVDARITDQQEQVFTELKSWSKAELDALPTVEVRRDS